jgi:hypothetical protein
VSGFTDAKIALDLHGLSANHAIAMALPPSTGVKDQVQEFIRRWEKAPVEPGRRDDPVWAENTVDGDDVDLFEVLPLGAHREARHLPAVAPAALTERAPRPPREGVLVRQVPFDHMRLSARGRRPAIR